MKFISVQYLKAQGSLTDPDKKQNRKKKITDWG
jgi:hypothetical protein